MTPYLLAVVSVLFWMVLPGVAVGVLSQRRAAAPSLVRFATTSLASGLGVWTLGGALLVRIGGIEASVVWSVGAVLALGSVIVLVVWGRALVGQWASPDTTKELAAGIVTTSVAAAPVVVLMAQRRDTLLGSTPWYYWRLVRETIIAGRLPAHSFEWGTRLAFLDDYPGFTASSAVLAVASGRPSTLVAAQVMRVVAALTTALAGYLLARTVGANRVAAAAASVVIVSGTTFVTKLASFRPESAGYALMLLIPALAVSWLQHREPVDLVVLAGSALALSEIHGVDWVFAMGWVVGLTVGALCFGRHRRETRRAAFGLLAAIGATWLAGRVFLGGGLSGAEKLGNLPRTRGGIDPTWLFRNLVVGDTRSGSPPALASVARGALRSGFAGLSWQWWAGAVVVTLIGVGAMLLRRGELRGAALRLLTSVVVTLVVVLVFSAFLATNYSTDVPRRTGYARLFPMMYVFLPIAAAVVITAISRGRRWLGRAIALVLAVAVFIPAARWTSQLDVQQPSRTALGALRDIRLPASALVLTNSYSEGFVPDVTGGRGVLDGRAPYTEAGVLQRVNGQLRRSIHWFAAPSVAGVAQPLPFPGITHVLISTGTPWALGNGVAFPTDVAALDARPDLQVARVGPGFKLYRVVAAG